MHDTPGTPDLSEAALFSEAEPLVARLDELVFYLSRILVGVIVGAILLAVLVVEVAIRIASG